MYTTPSSTLRGLVHVRTALVAAAVALPCAANFQNPPPGSAIGSAATSGLPDLVVRSSSVEPRRSALDAPVQRSRSVALDSAALAAPHERVRVELFQDRVLEIVLEQRVETSAGLTWTGSIVGTIAGRAQFAVADGAVCGTLRSGHELFRLSSRADGNGSIEEIDEARLPPCATERRERIAAVNPPPAASTSFLATTPATIDVLVVYTPEARAGQGGTAAMNALIDLAMLETNQAYAQSGVTQRLRLVQRAELTSYHESGNWGLDLGRIQNPSDGYMDEVAAWRNASGADCVVLIEDAAGSCGVAYLMGALDPSFEAYAYAIVARNCATGNYTFGHELGHVMGLTHDRDNGSDQTQRASYGPGFLQSNGTSWWPGISAFGRYVAFVSDATNLVTGDSNGVPDVFLRDRDNRSTIRVNLGPASVQTGGAIGSPPAVSSTGQFVAFESSSAALVTGDTNAVADIFVRDTLAGLTTRVSVGAAGAQANAASTMPSISENGRWIAFHSAATNLVAGASGLQVYAYDRIAAVTVLVSATNAAAPGNGGSSGAWLSSDGHFCAFASSATNLIVSDTNGRPDIFVRDLVAGTTLRASVGVGGSEANGDSPYWPGLSSNGRYVVFSSAATNLVTGDTNGTWDVFVRDTLLGTTLRASLAPGGVQANGPSGWASRATLSSDGRHVGFLSRATNLVTGDTNAVDDVFVRDTLLDTTLRASVSPSGNQGTNSSGEVDQPATIALSSSAGAYVAFGSFAVLDNDDTNGFVDVYVFSRLEPDPPGLYSYSYGYRTPDTQWRTIMSYAPGTRVQHFSNPSVSYAGQALGIADPAPFAAEAWRSLNESAATVAAFRGTTYSTFCFGDGSATPCPCGNASAVGSESGCVNSLGLAGKLVSLGVASIAADSVVLFGSGMPNSSALYFQGSAQQGSGLGSVFGDGLRCAGGAVLRLGTKINASNASQYPMSGDPSISTKGLVTTPGTFHYQAWYRNAATFCASEAFNLTNGLSVAWQL